MIRINASQIQALIISTCILIASCKESPSPKPMGSLTENDKYYPLPNHGTWTYESIVYDLVEGRSDTSIEMHQYFLDSLKKIHFRNGQAFAYNTWQNVNHQLMCCKNRVLLDYNQVNCSQDSIQIHKSVSGSTLIEIFQFCKKESLTSLWPYDKVPCIKTSQLNKNSDGSSLRILNYFGYEVGLIFREEIYSDYSGQVVKIGTRRLKSHKL